MSSLATQYLEGVIKLINRIVDEEAASIEAGANLLADAISNGQRIFVFGCTHSSLPIQDLVYRAGGLMLINPIFGPGIASLEPRPATLTSAIEQLQGYAKAILDNSPIQSEDVLILVSVSGRNSVPIEMAQIARERGVYVICVTSRVYSETVTSRHSSGKKMYEFANIVLDNKVDVGDALLEVEGVPQKICPASGVTSTALLHALVAKTVEVLLAKGIIPPVILAANVDGGAEYNAKLMEEYKDRIFYM